MNSDPMLPNPKGLGAKALAMGFIDVGSSISRWVVVKIMVPFPESQSKQRWFIVPVKDKNPNLKVLNSTPYSLNA